MTALHPGNPGRPLYEILLERQLAYLADRTDIRWHHVMGSTARFALHIPFCCEQLEWQVEFQRVAGTWIPDLVFPEEGFNPLLPSTDEEPLGSFLQGWKLEEEARLHSLLKRVIHRFSTHQRRVILDLGGADWRLKRAAETAPGKTGPLQMLYTHGHPGKATFVVGVDSLDVSRLQPFLARNWAGELKDFPPENLTRLISGVALRVVWTVNGGSAPLATYIMPAHLESLLGCPSPPAFGSRTTLEEYVPLAVEVLERRCELAGEWAMARQDLLDELPNTKLGTAVEIDVISARTAVYNLWRDGSLWIVWLDLNQEFPENVSPRITLQRQEPIPFERSYTSMPWSPRWTPKEMAKRISSFVSGEVKAASRAADLDYLTSQDSI